SARAARPARRSPQRKSASTTRPTAQKSSGSVNRQMANRKPVALREDRGDAGAMADAGIGLVANQAARRLRGSRGCLLQRDLRLGGRELVVDDLPEPVPLPLVVGLAPLGRRAQ